jgi:hypothetical protein
MQIRLLKPLALTLLLSGIIAMPVMAATSSSDEADANQKPHKKSLEATVARLEKEVAALKHHKMYASKHSKSVLILTKHHHQGCLQKTSVK